MGLFDVIKETAAKFLDDSAQQGTLYSRKQSADELLRAKFRLPDSETRVATVESTVYLEPLGVQAQNLPESFVNDAWDGKATLSESFVMFESYEDPKLLSFVLPLSTIRRVERLPSRSSMFALKITLYQDLQLVLQFDGIFSSCDKFCQALGANLRAQVPLAKGLRQINTTFYSEFLVESAILRKQGKSRAVIQAEIAPPAGGLGREFGYPGDSRMGQERAKMRLWLEYFISHGRNVGMARQPQFYKLIRVGLPNALRGEIWEVCCGSVHMRMKSRALYSSLLETHADETSLATEEIAKDLRRSLPEFPAYQSPKGIESLRRVLTAYSWMCPEVGYCQAMNIVTAALLIFQTEEQAFWTLHVLVHRILPGYYSRTMYGMLLDQKVLECLVERTMPVLWQHLVNMDVPLSVVSLPWFLSLFANSMPLPFAFRIIDLLMLDGSRVLFQVSLAVLRVNGELLLQAEDNTSVIEILKSYFDTLHLPVHPGSTPERTKKITKFQELLVTAFREFCVVTNDWIHELRAKHESAVLTDIENYAKRTQIRNIPRPHNVTQVQCGVIYDTFYAALQASRPGLGGHQGELDFYQFVTFMSHLVDWVHPRIIPRVDAESHKFLKLLFTSWDLRKCGSLTLADCVAGLDKLVEPVMMEVINYIFHLFTQDNESDLLDQQGILDVADGMLMMMRPFSESHDGAIMLDAETSKELRVQTEEHLSDKSGKSGRNELSFEEKRAEILEKLQQNQSAKYLGAVSSFIQRSYEVAGYKQVQAAIGKAEVSDAVALINLDEDMNPRAYNRHNIDKKTEETKDRHFKDRHDGSNISGLSLPHFRMVLLADETLELFFSETLRTTIHLTEKGTGVLSKKFSASAFRYMMDNVMREGLQLADGLWSNNIVTDANADELGDDTTVKASDRALLDL